MGDRDARRQAVVTGARAGIGAATARALAGAGFAVHLGARRLDRLEEVAAEIAGTGAVASSATLDVTSSESIEAFVASCPETIDLLVNNAGKALGRDRLEDSTDESWQGMWETNVLGLVRVIRALLPRLRRAPHAHLIQLGSISGFETYVGGAGYTASKFGVRALTKTLRLELLGEPIRVTEICPGLVETEFSVVRFDGDREQADAVYQGMTPLTAEDVADAIAWAATRPPHVNIDEIVIRPRDQATSSDVYRRGGA